MVFLEIVFLVLLLVLALPVLVFALQLAMALPARGKHQAAESAESAELPQPTDWADRADRAPASAGRRPSIAVLVPAHDEAAGIGATLGAVLAQLQPGDRLLVVADNCSDDTSAAATAAGAEAIVRCDAVRRGKGYALDFGVRHLALAPPEIVIIIDADCLPGAGALGLLAYRSLAAQRPVQALYLMRSPAGASLKTKVAEFAWTVKNFTRALGFQRAGLPCQLMGAGMAFPWSLIAQAELASGHIVEDLKLGLDFARKGQAPLFCPEALVTSVFPANPQGVQSQRTRWEHGHLAMMLKEGPPLLLESVRSGNRDLLALTLDMCVPPLALLTLLALVVCMAGMLLWAVTGDALPWSLALIHPAILGLAVLLAWARFGRAILSLRDLAYAPLYALWKIPLYLKFLVRRQVDWVRSHRDGS
jgi:cellulose synthase/poly-beta-1,6-N-acetylglucosamine synthase-like glycosyltransferase